MLELGPGDHTAQNGETGPVPCSHHQTASFVQSEKHGHDLVPAGVRRCPLTNKGDETVGSGLSHQE